MQIKQLPVKEFIENSNEKIIIDVRSPLEFTKGHIPGAVNIPLFNDEERKDVGTLYKKKGKKEAVLKGLEFVQPKLKSFVEEVLQIMQNRNCSEVFVYCWRGGARSESFTWLLKTSGIKAARLESGYKAYRNHVLGTFDKAYRFILLSGKTGCGKTEILMHLEKKGLQILDLEGIACHKGSAFGDLGQKKQPSPQQFENNLAYVLNRSDEQKIIWVENESPGIGGLFIPMGIRKIMEKAPIVNINLPESERIIRITKEYGGFTNERLEEKIKKISRKLGSENTKKAIDSLYMNRLEQAIKILLKYYDKTYTHYIEKHESGKTILNLDLEKDIPEKNAEIIRSEFERSFKLN